MRGRPDCACGLRIGTAGSQAVGDGRTEAFPPRHGEIRWRGGRSRSTGQAAAPRKFFQSHELRNGERAHCGNETIVRTSFFFCVHRGRAYCFQTPCLLRGLFLFLFFHVLGPLATYMGSRPLVVGCRMDHRGGETTRILCVRRKLYVVPNRY